MNHHYFLNNLTISFFYKNLFFTIIFIKMTYVEIHDKKQLHPHYEHRATKLDQKNKDFSIKQFQKIRSISSPKKLLETLGRISVCMNDRSTAYLPKNDLDNVCYIIINDYEDKRNELGVGPLNDGNLIAHLYHRLGYKIFYTHNANSESFTKSLGYFIKNTKVALTVFYSGRDNISDGIVFNDATVSKNIISEVISSNCCGEQKVTFINDSIDGGSVFDIDGCKNVVSFSVIKTDNNFRHLKEDKSSHGVFTYYFCKFLSEKPNISPKKLIEEINPLLRRFNENAIYDVTSNDLEEKPILS